jgi:hypothetical protein
LKIPLPNPEEFIQEIKDLLLENSFEIIAEKKYQVSREIA